ncbi:terminase large subunit domain-containing protein, partial [Aeromonas jandaei]|uniref:terminase large subunit domain-containing protein n=1 Tax=Aeromonas jandaei TaxID=650 RepID=UPI00366E16F9
MIDHASVLLETANLKPMIKKRLKRGLPRSWSAYNTAYPIRRLRLQSNDSSGFDFKDTEERFNKERGFRGENHRLEYSNEMLVEFAKCRRDPIYFIENYCHITTANGIQLINLRDFQVEAIETIHHNNKVLGLTSRQASKTTIVSCYLAWCLCFQEYYNAAILSHTIQGAENILNRVYQIMVNLPDFLSPCVIEKSRGKITTSTGVSIEAFASTGASLRGQSLHLCYLDEASHLGVDLSVFYPEVIAPACSFRTSKVILTTTPKGNDYFKLLWDGSKKTLGFGGNGFSRFTAMWYDIPENLFDYSDPDNPVFDNGKSFKAIKLAASSTAQFAVEYECSFASLTNNLLTLEALSRLKAGNPEVDPETPQLRMFKEPIRNARYLIGVDLGTQAGKDFSVALVYEIDSKEVVCTYRDNTSTLDDVACMIGNLAYLYNNAYLIIETGDKWNISAHVINVLNEYYDECRYYRTRL